jgi:ATP-dependent HslUV protease ATP-binding subunit HslU
MTSQLQSMFQNMSGDKTSKRKLKIKDALKVLREEEAAKIVNQDDIKQKPLKPLSKMVLSL